MGIDRNMIAMVGYDISHLSDYIKTLEEEHEDDWYDGIPRYSLNYNDVVFGYDCHTRSMFGKIVFTYDESAVNYEGDSEIVDIAELEKYRAAIWERYKLFLFDHTKIPNKEEPPFVLNFITWCN